MKLKPLQKYFFFLIVAIASCRQSTTIKRPDVSNIDVNIKIERFDQELSKINPESLIIQTSFLQQKYGIFYKNYFSDMLQIGHSQDSVRVQENLAQILKQKDFVDLNIAVNKIYPSMDKYDKELSTVFKYVKYYFPEYKIPRFIAYVSGFAYQTPIGEDYVGIGLDMFLGSDSEFYPALVHSIPLYNSRRFTPENITPRVVESVLREELYPMPDDVQNTLQHMIYMEKYCMLWTCCWKMYQMS